MLVPWKLPRGIWATVLTAPVCTDLRGRALVQETQYSGPTCSPSIYGRLYRLQISQFLGPQSSRRSTGDKNVLPAFLKVQMILLMWKCSPNYQPKAHVSKHYCPSTSRLGSEGPSHLPSPQPDFLTQRAFKKTERSRFHSWLYFTTQRTAAQTLIFGEAGSS